MGDFDAAADDRPEQTSKTLFTESVVKHGFSREGFGDTSGKSVSGKSRNDEDDKDDPSELDEPSLKKAYLHKKKPEQTKPGKSILKEVDTGKRKRSSVINSGIGSSGKKLATLVKKIANTKKRQKK